MIINDKYCASINNNNNNGGLNDNNNNNVNGGTFRSSKFHNLRQQNSISSSFSNTSSSSCSSISPTTTTTATAANTIQLVQATPRSKQQANLHPPKVIPICVPNSKYKLRYPIQNTPPQTTERQIQQQSSSPYEMSFPVSYAYNQHYGTVPASLSKLKTRASIGHLLNSNNSIKQHQQQQPQPQPQPQQQQLSFYPQQHYNDPVTPSFKLLPQQTHHFQFQTPPQQHHHHHQQSHYPHQPHHNSHYENQNIHRQVSNENLTNRNNRQTSFDNIAAIQRDSTRTNSLNRNSLRTHSFQPTHNNSTRTKIDDHLNDHDSIAQSTASLSGSIQKSTSSNESQKLNTNNSTNNSTKFYSLRKILTKNKSLSSNISNSSRSGSSDSTTRNKIDGGPKPIVDEKKSGFRSTTSNRRLGYSSSFNLNNRTKYDYDPSNRANTLVTTTANSKGNNENSNQETSTKDTNTNKDGSKVLRILKIYKSVLTRLQKRFNIHETNNKETIVTYNGESKEHQQKPDSCENVRQTHQSSIVITLDEEKSSPTSADKSTQTRYNFEIIPKESNDDDGDDVNDVDDNDMASTYDQVTTLDKYVSIKDKKGMDGYEEDILCDLEVASYFNGSSKPTATNDSYSQPSSFNSLTSSSGCYTGGGGGGSGSGSGSGTSNDLIEPPPPPQMITKHYNNDKLLLQTTNKSKNSYISNNNAIRKSHYENIYDNTTNYNYNYFYNNANNATNNANFIQFGTLC